MKVIDLRKQQALEADPKAIQQISFTANPDWAGQTAMHFIIEEAKETILDFSQGNICESVVILFCFDIMLV